MNLPQKKSNNEPKKIRNWVFGESVEDGEHFLFFCYASQYNQFVEQSGITDIVRFKVCWVQEGLFETLQHKSWETIRKFIEPILKEWTILHSN